MNIGINFLILLRCTMTSSFIKFSKGSLFDGSHTGDLSSNLNFRISSFVGNRPTSSILKNIVVYIANSVKISFQNII